MGNDRPKTIGEIILDGTLIDKAMRQAAREAIRRHKIEGLLVPVWRNGRTEMVDPDEIRIPEDEPAGPEARKEGG